MKYINILGVLIVNIVVFVIVGLLFMKIPAIDSLFSVVIVIFVINSIVAFMILSNRRRYEEKMTWIIIILFLPVTGLIIYLFFGLDYRLVRKNRGSDYNDKKLSQIEGKAVLTKQFITKFQDRLDFVELIENLTNKPVLFNSHSKLLNNGDELFPEMFKELRKAKHFIHLEFFIIKNSNVASELMEILIDKAKEGVEVRAMFDYFGALNFSKKYPSMLREAGGQLFLFNPISLKTLQDGINYRNHRKILIIDNKVGFTGGINIGDEYNHQNHYYGFWRDSHVVLYGEVVRSLHITFIKDWYYTTKEDILNDHYLTPSLYYEANRSSAIQVIDDGPNNHQSIIKSVYFKAIMEAKEIIRVSTPYLVPDSEILESLKIAALSGVKVQIIVPGKPDKKLVYYATMSYFEELLECGCEIFFYGKNFMHSKILTIDYDIASIGTTNIDFRSFNLHFENTVLLYGGETVEAIIESFNDDLKVSSRVNINEWKQRGYYKRFIETFARIFSPLL